MFDEREILKGIIDLHVHAGPSVANRAVDAADMLKEAVVAGYRGFLVKDHYFPSCMGVKMVQEHCDAKGVEIYSSMALNNSMGLFNTLALDAAINMGDFATTNGIAEKVTAEDGSYTWEFPEGTALEDITVTISMYEKEGYRDQYLIHQLTRTDVREDYASDAVFANFRNIASGELGENALFRSSSPVNNELGRAAYADDLAEANGIQTVMNLADSDELIQSYIDAEGFVAAASTGSIDEDTLSFGLSLLNGPGQDEAAPAPSAATAAPSESPSA